MKKVLSAELAGVFKSWFETEEVKDVISATEKSQDSDTGTFEVIITTENLDRYNEVIKLDGWELEHYRKNPVVLWGHDHKQLIGMATSVEITDGKMIAKGRFAPNALGQEVRKLYEAGFLRATSVGFIEKEREGNLITKAELIEFSFVSVPANPYALTLAMEKELSLNELVTKGFLNIKETEAPMAVTEPVTDPLDGIAEKKLSTKAVTPIVEHLKAALVALEALETEPERDDAPEDAETEEEKELKAYAEHRKTVQALATLVGEVLADSRQFIEKH